MAQASTWAKPAGVAGGIVVVVALVAFFVLRGHGPQHAPDAATKDMATQDAATDATKDMAKDGATQDQAAPSETSSAADPAATLAPIIPSLDVVRVTAEGDATVAGKAAPEAAVSLRVDGVEIANVPADATGAYASLFTLPSATAPRVLTVAATGKDGVEVLGQDQVILAPTAAPLKITEAGVEVLAPTPADMAQNVVINSVVTTGDKVTVGGTGAADQTVRLYVNDADSGTATVDAAGNWYAELVGIAPGEYKLRADQLDASGAVTSRYETPFKREAVVAAVAPIAPVTITVQPGLTLWAIAEQNFGDGAMYVQVFEANKDMIRDPNLIYPGQVFNIPKAP